jgi:hypothetical protein
MEWFQKICCETISGVVFLVDLRNLHLNIASNVMLTTQKNTMRATAVESINTFLEALKTFYLNRQLNSSGAICFFFKSHVVIMIKLASYI